MLRRLLKDPILATLGGFVFLFTLTVYLLTVSRTVSFWDCGEFIACAHILGIPHPPGTPVYVFLGRVFALLPFVADIGHRVNLLSVVSSAAAATVAYFVLARLITMWYSDNYPDPKLDWGARISIYAGSFCGALLFAFSTTNWGNSVEAEVYGLAMLLMMALIWLALIWAKERNEPGSDRYLIAIAYLAFLSIGVHMTVFLVMPPIFVMVIMLSPRLRKDWHFWLAAVVLFLVTSNVLTFLWAVTGLLVLTGIIWLMGSKAWRLSFLMIVAALLGFSSHAYIPIRAQQNPAINENDPKTWSAFRGFLERKQYGEESMFRRAMTRRGQWSNQLGQHQRMGFWGFFDRQYGFNDRAFFPLLLLGIFGIYQLMRARKTMGILFLSLLLITSVGLIWYMNFADGTLYNAEKQDAYLEVRDRDYFFTPAFILFGMAVGLGGAALIGWLRGGSMAWVAMGAAIVALVPFGALRANYVVNDRSRNFLAYDYGHNLLASADQNALFFTNGDNDTFPLWCLQEVYGVRTDVRVINLSLLNTTWYIKQLRDQHKVPMDLTNDQIDRMIHYRRPDGSIRRIQDQMIDAILPANKGQYPVNFAVTVTESNRRFREQSLEQNLVMAGLAYRLVSDTGTGRVDLERVQDLIWNRFQYRGVNDESIYKDENALRMMSNYTSGFFFAADTLRRAGEFEEAIRHMQRAKELLPGMWEPFVYLAQLYTDSNRPDSLEALYQQAEQLPIDWERAATSIGYSLRRLGRNERGEAILREVMARKPNYDAAYRTLVQVYFADGRYDSLLAMMERWLVANPRDQETRGVLDSVRALATKMGTAPPDTSLP